MVCNDEGTVVRLNQEPKSPDPKLLSLRLSEHSCELSDADVKKPRQRRRMKPLRIPEQEGTSGGVAVRRLCWY